MVKAVNEDAEVQGLLGFQASGDQIIHPHFQFGVCKRCWRLSGRRQFSEKQPEH